MNTYPDLVKETVQMIQWMDALIADDEDQLTVAGFVANSYKQSLSLLQAALANDPQNADLGASLDTIRAASHKAIAYDERVRAKALDEAQRLTRH